MLSVEQILATEILYVERGRNCSMRPMQLDCWGFVMWLAKENYGYSLPSYLEYRLATPNETRGVISNRSLEFRRLDKPCAGAIVTLELDGPHVALCISDVQALDLTANGVTPRKIHKGAPYRRRANGFWLPCE